MRISTLPGLCLLAACSTADPPPAIHLDPGGDAWALTREVRGTADPGCDPIEIITPSGLVPARREGARFTAVVPLDPGRNELVARCRGSRGDARSAPVWIDARVRPHPRPRAEVALEPGAVVLRDAAPGAWERRWTPREDNAAPLALRSGERLTAVTAPELRLAPPDRDGEYYVTLSARDREGREGRSTAVFLVEGGRPRLPPPGWTPRWAREAVIYGVLPRLFGQEGLRSVTARLDALAELGVTVLWLAPVFGAPPGDYGYAVTDYFTVREELGGEAALKELVDAAHDRGLRVILDFVLNHTARQHRYFVDAETGGDASPYRAFYEWRPDGTPAHYFDWTHLPNLDLDHPEVARWLTEAAQTWVERAGADGFRIDAAWGPRERSPDFLRRWAAELRRVRPDLLLLAEASARDGYWEGAGFDLAYDWTDRPGEWAWQAAFEDRAGEGRALARALAGRGAHRVARFLANNDTGPRFHDRYGLGIHDAAFTLLFTTPGVPMLFTGDEVAASYEPYANPPPLAFTDARGVRERIRALIALRRALPALRSATLLPVGVGDDPELLGYARLDDGGGAPALVLLNFASGPRAVTPTLPAEAAALAAGLRDARSGERFAKGARIPLAPGQGRVLVPEG